MCFFFLFFSFSSPSVQEVSLQFFKFYNVAEPINAVRLHKDNQLLAVLQSHAQVIEILNYRDDSAFQSIRTQRDPRDICWHNDVIISLPYRSGN